MGEESAVATSAVGSEAVDLLGELIRFDTVNPPGNEGPAQELLAQRLRDAPTEPVCTVGDATRDGRTIVLSRCSSTAAGFVQKPVCTGDIWMMVLRGDTSQ